MALLRTCSRCRHDSNVTQVDTGIHDPGANCYKIACIATVRQIVGALAPCGRRSDSAESVRLTFLIWLLTVLPLILPIWPCEPLDTLSNEFYDSWLHPSRLCPLTAPSACWLTSVKMASPLTLLTCALVALILSIDFNADCAGSATEIQKSIKQVSESIASHSAGTEPLIFFVRIIIKFFIWKKQADLMQGNSILARHLWGWGDA